MRQKRQRIYMDALRTPMGWIRAAGDEEALLLVLLPCADSREMLRQELSHKYGPVEFLKGGAVVAGFLKELEEYFQGSLLRFQTPVRPQGTPFQKKVWKVLTRIPTGETRSYGWVAEKAGVPGGARAVGQANGSNPLPLIVPCHRVINADGKIGGFSSGVGQKKWLLQWESRPRKNPKP